MCSHLLKGMMENYQGDLADIFRARTTAADGGSSAADSWQFPSSDPISYSSSDPVQDFGDPFSYMGDPLLPNIDSPLSGFFYNSNIIKSDDGGGGGISISHSVIVHDDHEMMIKRRPSDIFSRMLQISPNAKSPVSPPSDHCQPPAAAVVAAGAYPAAGFRVPPILISPSSSKGCLVESSGLQISSPRNTGIKRRKSQAKKVVCIPASSPANSRATGEIVPSDLWAWRKYGQKPIKGSPYPRGYYRCSSSKGCSARKQVERSRTDPNMLVITYTSEHNHPWPTQRNALAGSTRSQPSKNTTTNSATKTSHRDTVNPKHENRITSFTVKEETADRDFDNQLEMENVDQFELGFSYKPSLEDDSFFADLGDIETDDPLEDLLLENPFSFYSWAATTATAAAETTVSSAACYAKDNREL